MQAHTNTAAAGIFMYFYMQGTRELSVSLGVSGNSENQPNICHLMALHCMQANVGRVQAISVRLNATGSSKKWGLGYIDLYNYASSQPVGGTP
jgi:hypothetical protein